MAKNLTEMQFEKMHGASNDFIFLDVDFYLNFLENSFSNSTTIETNKTLFLREFVKTICHRNQGVGADGVVFFHKKKNSAKLDKKQKNITSTQVLIVNADGSFAATCGNALRCLGLKLLRDKLWDGLEKLNIERLPPDIFYVDLKEIKKDEDFIYEKSPFAVLISGKLKNKHELANIGVVMGYEKKVFLTPLVENSLIHFGSEIDFLSPVFIQLSNPHWVFISPHFKHFSHKQFEEFGQLAQGELRKKVLGESVPLANIGMLALEDKNSIGNQNEISNNPSPQNWNLHVFERGVGLTACCGSGATAARVALEFSERIPKDLSRVCFKMPGGTVSVENIVISNKMQRVLCGDAQFVFQGFCKLTSFSK